MFHQLVNLSAILCNISSTRYLPPEITPPSRRSVLSADYFAVVHEPGTVLVFSLQGLGSVVVWQTLCILYDHLRNT